MYRVFLSIVFLSYCSSAPFMATKLQKSVSNDDRDGADFVDSNGSGYVYFKNQQIDVRPSSGSSAIDLSDQDIATYLRSSALDYPQDRPDRYERPPTNNNAYGQQQLIPRSNSPVQNLLPKTPQNQQPTYNNQKDFPQVPSSVANKYNYQQENLPRPPKLLAKNKYANQQQDDYRPMNPQQQRYGNQQQQQQEASFIPQTWNNQPRFSSSYDNQNTNTGFMSSQIPQQQQRLNYRPQPMFNNGW